MHISGINQKLLLSMLILEAYDHDDYAPYMSHSLHDVNNQNMGQVAHETTFNVMYFFCNFI